MKNLTIQEYLYIKFDDGYGETIDIKTILEKIAEHPTLKSVRIEFASLNDVEEQMLACTVGDIERVFTNNYHLLEIKIIPLATEYCATLNKVTTRNNNEIGLHSEYKYKMKFYQILLQHVKEVMCEQIRTQCECR